MCGTEIDADGKTVAISGDSTNATLIEVFASKSVKTISWNGKALKMTKTSYGSLTASWSRPTVSFSPPELGPLKVQDSLPERLTSYDDSGPAWVDANHMTTPNPSPPDTLPVLYVDEYGSTKASTSGAATSPATQRVSSSACKEAQHSDGVLGVNGDFVGSWLGNATQFSEIGNLTLSFSNATVNADKNILLVKQVNSGHDKTTGALNPPSILNTTLISDASFTS